MQNPPDDFKQQIRGTIDGDEVVLTVSARFGGAVESVTWRGKEFINIYDHGRQISYAWGMDGYGECFNPTEPGSASDLFKQSSTTELLEVCNPESNLLTTKIHPAFWLGPGEKGFCGGGAVTAVNDTLISDQLMYKTIEIGYKGIENVIAFTVEITLPESHRSNQLEVPTGYMTYEFTNYWRFDPALGTLEKPESQDLVVPWSFVNVSPIPPILATEDGEFAMGAYSPEDVIAYEILWYNVPNRVDRTNKWNIVVREEPAPAGVYTYRSFVIVGTLDQVTEAMTNLYALEPTDFHPPEGYVDVANCDEIAGWAWDPKTPDFPIEVEFRQVNEDGTETTLFTTRADRFREDLPPVLGDNGKHGYRIVPSEFLYSGETYQFRIYGLNSNQDLSDRALLPTEHSLNCPQFQPRPTPTQKPTAVPTETPVAADPGANGGLNIPCIGGTAPLFIGVVFWLERKRRLTVRSKR